jgi:signal transduction histidine kinase
MTIYTRIFIPFVVALAAGSVAAWWLATALVQDALSSRLEDQLERAVEQLASGRLPLSPDLLDRLGVLLGAKLIVIPAAGSNTSEHQSAITTAARNLLAQTPGGGSVQVRHKDTHYQLVARPIRQGVDRRYRALAAATALTEIDAASRRVARLLAFAGIAGIVLIAWVVHLTARDITRPLAQLARLAGRLASGELGARAEVCGPRELENLGRAVNHMADRLQQLQREIAERNRLSALGEMASKIAHEIRNPLTAIKLHVELLAETSQDPRDSRSLATLLNEINRLELVVATTLSLGRPTSGQDAQPTDLNALVEEVVTLMQPQLAHRRIRLESLLRPVPPARLDGDRIKQVLLNLVNNAAEELPEGGRIRLTTASDADGRELLLGVEDSGPGIPEARRSALFEQGISGKPHGLGVGLVISREIVEQHAGRIEAEHSAELGGARFVVRIPLSQLQ